MPWFQKTLHIKAAKLGALRKECKDIEFGEGISTGFSRVNHFADRYSVFVDAPHILLPAELDAPLEELTALQSNPETAMRGWWTANEDRTKITGLQESLLVIKGVLKNERFDVSLTYFQNYNELTRSLCREYLDLGK